jgi:class 3 adenylate cyclase
VGLVQVEEEDVFGAMVNYTARVQSQTKGSEIWVSDRAKSDIDEEKAKTHQQIRWIKHPDCELKGFSGKHVLWSAILPDETITSKTS